MNFLIRKAEARDAPQLVKLLESIALLHHNGRPDIFAANGSKYDEDAVISKLSNAEEIILVAARGDEILGYAMCKTLDYTSSSVVNRIKTLFIDDLCVAEPCRGIGVGGGLLESVKECAREQGCYNVELNVWSFNKNAIAFYEKYGCVEQRKRMEIIL